MTIQEFIVSLFEIQITAHITHLQTNSYAAHKALNELYDALPDHLDSYVETYQGIHGIVKTYPQVKFKEKETSETVSYLKEKVTQYRSYREEVKELELQAKLDDLIELLNTTIYKLKFLK